MAAVDRNSGNKNVYDGYLNMRGRHMIETGQWEEVELAEAGTDAGNHANWVSVVGMSAAYRGDADTAAAAVERLNSLSAAATAKGSAYTGKQIAILAKEVTAIAKLKSGDKEGAVMAAREAAEMELRDMNAPSGPPVPMKPAVELYGDILLAVGRPAEAFEAYEVSLAWIPLRTPSVIGLEEAAAQANNAQASN
jgi:hypothetical protein